MRSTFIGYEVSKRTIQISQKALDVTNHNLSNINTDGYSRQRVDLNSSYILPHNKLPLLTLSVLLLWHDIVTFPITLKLKNFFQYLARPCFILYVPKTGARRLLLSTAPSDVIQIHLSCSVIILRL